MGDIADRLRSGRAALPVGTFPVAAGLAVSGLAAYGYLAVSAHALGPARYASVSVLWSVTYLGALGFFLPLEQEVARAVAARFTKGEGGGPVVHRAAQIGLAGLVGLIVVIVAAGGVLTGRLFDHHSVLLLSLALAMMAYLPVHLTRGMLSGSGRFGSYGVLLGAEGVIRLAACVVLAIVAVQTPGPYGLALALAPFASLLIVVSATADARRPGPPAPVSEVSAALGWLLAGALALQALVNGPAVAIKLLASPSEQAQTGRFIAGLLMCRVPLFFFAAVQVSLLPKLAAMTTSNRIAELRLGLRRLIILVLAVGGAGAAVAYVVGAVALHVFFGPNFQVSRVDLGVLGAASGGVMAAIVYAQAMIAFREYARAKVGWVAGLVAFGAVLALPIATEDRVSFAFLAGSVVAAVAMWTLLRPLLAPDRARWRGAPGVLSEPLVA
jgi:O-antigen/teichoic acid export membrane protein